MVAGQGDSGTKIVVELLNGKKEKARLAQSGESAPPLSTGTATNDKPIQEDDVADDDEDDKKDGTPPSP